MGLFTKLKCGEIKCSVSVIFCSARNSRCGVKLSQGRFASTNILLNTIAFHFKTFLESGNASMGLEYDFSLTTPWVFHMESSLFSLLRQRPFVVECCFYDFYHIRIHEMKQSQCKKSTWNHRNMLLNIRIGANVCPTYQTHTIYFNSILPFNQKRGLFLECLISETLSHFSSIRSNSAISLHEFASQKQITERYKGVFVRNL